MPETIRRVLRAIRRFTREHEPLVVVNTIAAAVVAAVEGWQGDLEGDHAWIAVVWGIATFLARRLVTPASSPDGR